MYIAYYDESGDDGWPKTSTDLFVLSSVYMHHDKWKENYRKVNMFRRELWKSYKFPFSEEFHTREFLLDKDPYKHLNMRKETKKEILELVCSMIATLDIQIISVCINKKAIRSEDYPVLDRAFTYSIQRIENDLNAKDMRFMIISDEGRVGKMRKTSRRIQRYNPIQSKFKEGTYRNEIRLLIEDPLPKKSSESYFIQVADTVSYLVSLYMKVQLGLGSIPNRIASYINADDIVMYLDRIKPRLNLKASSANVYGIVCYPKQ